MGTNINDFLRVKKKTKRTYPNQYICEEKANGIICNGNFYPYKIAEGTLLQKKGIRYYLKQYVLAGYCINRAAGIIYLQAYVGGSQKFIAYCPFPVTIVNQFVQIAFTANAGVLCDEETAVTGGSDVDDGLISYIYAEIDVLPGHLNPKVIEE